ncbi:MAG TPA: hypothetical protein VIJ68_04910 [Candidatus Saccharimonadales bacterium]
MKDLLIHPATQQRLTGFMKAPSHAVLLIGPTGSGKRILADKLAESVLDLKAGELANYPYSLDVTSEDKSIGIDAVRELERFLTLKVPRQAPYNRSVIIENAQRLSLEAQNALLKTLEEPPQGVLIILTVDHEQTLLPTIRSRMQSISVKRPDRALTEAHFQKHDFGAASIKQAYAISGGLPGLMHALLEQADHPLTLATERARQLLSQSAYERLLSVDELSKQPALALDVTFILQQMAHVSLQSTTGRAAIKWQAVLTAAYLAAEALTTSAQPKLALTNLMLSF